MNTSAAKSPTTARALRVATSNDTLTVELTDGRTVTVPIRWYPRLAHGTSRERNNWRLVGRGVGIHWPDLDEDISVDNLLTGSPSAESQPSLMKWLEQRRQRQRVVAKSK